MAGLVHCDRCGGHYGEIAFRQICAHICLLCEQTERDNKKQVNRAKDKARNTFYRHADRFIKKGFAATRSEFAALFGWNIDRMVHDLEHIYDNWCSGCSRVFRDMGHGLSDITLDICDVGLLPYYASNTRWICHTCNGQKGRTPPDKWGARVAYNNQWLAQQKKIRGNPLIATPLFHWAAARQSDWVTGTLDL